MDLRERGALRLIEVEELHRAIHGRQRPGAARTAGTCIVRAAPLRLLPLGEAEGKAGEHGGVEEQREAERHGDPARPA
ncbi:MAG: hypothetical protein U0574_00995 [Phycisphaerales bacterium]